LTVDPSKKTEIQEETGWTLLSNLLKSDGWQIRRKKTLPNGQSVYVIVKGYFGWQYPLRDPAFFDQI